MSKNNVAGIVKRGRVGAVGGGGPCPLRPLASFLCKPAVFGLALSLLAAASPGRAETPATLPARIEMLWSTPITAGTTTADTSRGEGLVLRAGAAAPDGAVVALGSRLGAQGSVRVLLLDAAGTGPDGAVPLELAPPRTWLSIPYRPIRTPMVLGLAVGHREEVWLGGSSNNRMGVASTEHCDAYLVVLDRDGKPVWERTYNAGSCSRIEGIAPAPAGGFSRSAASATAKGPRSPLFPMASSSSSGSRAKARRPHTKKTSRCGSRAAPATCVALSASAKQ